ncbi:MAG: hypothetical protein RR636_03510 [Clostridium sp.]|uniref:hypothetical protein n=1 Tax=Clostridium sp. TaxID=1506 RepID=UPI003020ED4B
MVKLKRNWLDGSNMIVGIFMATYLGFCMSSLLFINSNLETKEVLQAIREQLYIMSVFALSMYPVFSFKCVIPQVGSEKIYPDTSNLPFSKKQLLFKSLKPWIIIFPIYILVGAFLNSLLRERTETLGLMYLCSLIKPIILIVGMSIVTMQMISGIIIAFAKGIRWYKVLGGLFIGNGIITGICILGLGIFNVETTLYFNWMFIIVGVFFIASLILILTLWKDVENMHR